MDKKKVSNLLRAQLNFPIAYKIFNVGFAILFSMALISAVFLNAENVGAEWYWLLLSSFTGVVFLFLFALVFSKLPPPSRRAEVVLAIMLFILLLSAQIVLGIFMRSIPDPYSGFGVAYTYAENYAYAGDVPDYYFFANIGDTGIYILWSIYFSLLNLIGVSDFLIPALVLNAVVMLASVVVLYFCVRKLFGSAKAMFVLVASLFVLPFLLYVPVPFSGTLAMPFPVLAVLVWINTRSRWRKGEVKRVVIYFLLISAMLGFVALLHTAVLVIWFAIAMDLVFMLGGKGKLRLLVSGLLVCALVFFGVGRLRWFLPMMPEYNSSYGAPLSAKFMMGLRENGGYNQEDMDEVLSYPDKASRSEYVYQEISSRVAEYGPLGMAEHTFRKLGYTFGDGMLGVNTQLGQDQELNGIKEFVLTDGLSMNMAAYISFAIQAGMMVWMCVGAIRSLIKRNNALTFVRVGLGGLVIALLIWDTGPYYLLCFLPLMMLCSVEASMAFVNKPKKEKDAGKTQDSVADAEAQAGETPLGKPAPPPMPLLDGNMENRPEERDFPQGNNVSHPHQNPPKDLFAEIEHPDASGLDLFAEMEYGSPAPIQQ